MLPIGTRATSAPLKNLVFHAHTDMLNIMAVTIPIFTKTTIVHNTN